MLSLCINFVRNVLIPESVIQPSPVDDHVPGFPSSASFCSAALGILATVAKEDNIHVVHKKLDMPVCSQTFCSAVLGILATVAKEDNTYI